MPPIRRDRGPGQLSGGVAGPLPAGGFQQIAHRLRLHQIQTAVKERHGGRTPPVRPVRAPWRRGTPAPERSTHGGSEAVELSGVLTGVGGRAPGIGGQHLVDDRPLPVQQVAVDQAAGGMGLPAAGCPLPGRRRTRRRRPPARTDARMPIAPGPGRGGPRRQWCRWFSPSERYSFLAARFDRKRSGSCQKIFLCKLGGKNPLTGVMKTAGLHTDSREST